MSGLLDTARAYAPASCDTASEAELQTRGQRDLASISDALTDALQAATCYLEAAHMIAADKPPIDGRDRDVLDLAKTQVKRASHAVKHLHRALSTRPPLG